MAVGAAAANIATIAFPDRSIGTVSILVATAAGAAAVSLLTARWGIAQLAVSREEQDLALSRVWSYVDFALNRSYRVTLDQPVRLLTLVEAKEMQAQHLEGWQDAGTSTTTSAFVASMMQSPRCTVITGNPGSGKTTVLLKLASQLLEVRKNSGSGYVPLPVQLKDWHPSSKSMSNWLTQRVSDQLGLSSSVAWYWLKRGDAVFLMDGIDELMPSYRQNFLIQLNRWSRSGAGTRIVLTCRFKTYPELSERLAVDQVAALLSYPSDIVRSYLGRLTTESSEAHRLAAALYGLLDRGALQDELRRPAFLDLLRRSIAAADDDEETDAAGDDAGAMAFKLGNEAMERGDLESAREAYAAAMRVPGSSWRAPAAVRLGVTLQALGRHDQARRALLDSVGFKLEDGLGARVDLRDDDLTDVERAVLDAMDSNITYDEAQLGDAVELTPSEIATVLRSLREKGLVEPVSRPRQADRFIKTPLDLQSAA